jgi:predicted nucleotidyltransferase
MSTGLSGALFPRTRRLVLRELVLAGEIGLHLRGIARRTGLDPSGVRRELQSLVESGIAQTRNVGSQKLFTLNPHCAIYHELRMMILKTVGLADELKKALEPLGPRIKLAYIYGSIAAGADRAESDIDLIVVGRVSLSEVVRAVSGVARSLGREINIRVMSVSEYRSRLKIENSFEMRIQSGPIITLIGGTDDI